MEITLQVDDIELFAKALNNSIIAYSDIISALKLGCNVPKHFCPLRALEDEELDRRIDCLIDVCEQVEEIETMITDAWKNAFK